MLVPVLCGGSSAREPYCEDFTATAGMARAKSAAASTAWKRKSGDGCRAKIVFAFRCFELHPGDRGAAASVLDLIPHNEEEDSVLHTFGDFLCDAATDKDVDTLAGLGERLPPDLPRAVLLVPDKMLDYVSYSHVSVQDPHSDYAVQMQTVCRRRNREFVKAVNRLQPDEKNWFVSRIFNPERCRALALPEAEE
jgi:hypothetical protein